jgi:hypothetical protein
VSAIVRGGLSGADMNGGVNGVPGQGMAQAKQPGEASYTAIATQSVQHEGMER